jgi:hypothetical protein
MKILSDGGASSTIESLRFWEDNRTDFGTFIEAYVFYSEASSLMAGRLIPVRGSTRTDAPTLVVVDERGDELWLSACSCGYEGTGPTGTADLLLREGFDARLVVEVFRTVRLHLVKGESEPRLAEYAPNERGLREEWLREEQDRLADWLDRREQYWPPRSGRLERIDGRLHEYLEWTRDRIEREPWWR